MKLRDILLERTQQERKRQAGVKHDQFFTQPAAAKKFASWVKSQPFFKDVKKIIEPAAGNGELLKHFPGAIGYDLDPQSDNIKQADFLKAKIPMGNNSLVVMNPPYGKSSNLAVRFFNRAAELGADYIAMIVPRTFRKRSVSDKLHDSFHLVDEYILPKNSFYLPAEGDKKEAYDVPTVAQVWERRDSAREKPERRMTSDKFQFVGKEQADFAFRRKGRRAGQIVVGDEVKDTNPNSFFYIKGDPALFRKVDWSKMGHDVMGSRSISKAEIVDAV